MDAIAKYLDRNNFDLTITEKIYTEIYRKLSTKPENNLRFDNGVYKILILRKNTVYYEIIGNTVRVLRIRAGRMNVEMD